MIFDCLSFKDFCEVNMLTEDQATIILLEKIGELKRKLGEKLGIN